MIYSMKDKINEKKESRSLTIDSILGLETAIKEAEDLDNFNNSFLFNPNLETKPDLPAIQDLILLYYREAAIEDGSYTEDPSISEYTKDSWEAILNNALSYSGDGIFYPFMPGANVSASLGASGINPSERGNIVSSAATQGTLIAQNAADIALRATKTEADSLSDTVSAQGILISQNAKEIEKIRDRFSLMLENLDGKMDDFHKDMDKGFAHLNNKVDSLEKRIDTSDKELPIVIKKSVCENLEQERKSL